MLKISIKFGEKTQPLQVSENYFPWMSVDLDPVNNQISLLGWLFMTSLYCVTLTKIVANLACDQSISDPRLFSHMVRWTSPMSPYFLSVAPFITGLTSIPGWISNFFHYNVWNEMTYPFSNYNGGTVQIWERISNFIVHFTGRAITYPCWD